MQSTPSCQFKNMFALLGSSIQAKEQFFQITLAKYTVVFSITSF